MKKIRVIIIQILIITIFFLCLPKIDFATQNIIKIGDINTDGVIDSRDTLRLLKHIAASTIQKINNLHPDWILNGNQLKAADINEDGVIDSRDTLRELEYIAASTIPKIAEEHPEWKTYIETKWTVGVAGIKLDKTNMTIYIGKIGKINATIVPADTSDKIIKWSSSNIKVATVDGLGNVTGKSKGIAIITATTSNGKKGTCKVTVNPIVVNSITLKQKDRTIAVGTSLQLNAMITPTNADNKSIQWSSSNNQIAKVSASGLVYGVKPGVVTITATTSNGKKATCIIRVNIPPKSISLNKTNATMTIGNTLKLIVNFNPTNTTSKEVNWTSSNSNVVSVGSTKTINGTVVITAKSEGTATITATHKYGQKATCKVTVNKEKSSNSNNGNSTNKSKTQNTSNKNTTSSSNFELAKTVLWISNSLSYINNVQKIDTNKYYVKWDSSDKKIATVKENGEIIAQKSGYVEIIAKILKKSNNDLEAAKKCYVHVVNTKIVKYTSNGKNKLKMQLNGKNIDEVLPKDIELQYQWFAGATSSGILDEYRKSNPTIKDNSKNVTMNALFIEKNTSSKLKVNLGASIKLGNSNNNNNKTNSSNTTKNTTNNNKISQKYKNLYITTNTPYSLDKIFPNAPKGTKYSIDTRGKIISENKFKTGSQTGNAVIEATLKDSKGTIIDQASCNVYIVKYVIVGKKYKQNTLPTYSVSLGNAGGAKVLSHINSYYWYSTNKCVSAQKNNIKNPTFQWTSVTFTGKIYAVFQGESSNTKYFLYAEKDLRSLK